jgi:hypothetical protein
MKNATKGKFGEDLRRKGNLPSKICACCGRPFLWRKKWARDWDSVKFCSDRCRTDRGANDKAQRAL